MDETYPKPKIEKGVRRKSRRKYPWLEDLEVGDSFLWPATGKNGLAAAAYSAGVNISMRRVDEKNYRVWRV